MRDFFSSFIQSSISDDYTTMAQPPAFHPYVQNLRVLQLWADRQQFVHRRRLAILRYIQQQQQEGQRRQRRPRAKWVSAWLTEEKRRQYGAYYTIMRELHDGDVAAFLRYMRFEPAMWQELRDRVCPQIDGMHMVMREPIEAPCKLAITLRYLATGETFRSLSFQFRVAHNTIGKMIPEVCEALIAEYAPEVISIPITVEGWQAIAEKFEKKWNFPHCVGAIDGKHVAIKKPSKSGSLFFNYKKFFSIILLAIADADYRFIHVEVGREGSCSDTQVFNHSEMYEAFANNELHLPPPDEMTNDNERTPYFLLGDDAFALKTWLLKPYSRRSLSKEERIFNYRLSRARRVVENAFGLLVQRFRVLLKTMEVNPESAKSITLACVMLHNLIIMRYPRVHRGLGDRVGRGGRIVQGAWRQGLYLFGNADLRGGNFGTSHAKKLRDTMKTYFSSPAGAVSWQDDMI